MSNGPTRYYLSIPVWATGRVPHPPGGGSMWGGNYSTPGGSGSTPESTYSTPTSTPSTPPPPS